MTERLKPSFQADFFGPENYRPEQFSQEEKTLLGPFFSNTNRPVFLVSSLPTALISALIGRHSQSPDSMRRAFLDEFIRDSNGLRNCLEKGSLGAEQFLDIKAANDFLSKNFAQRGHDSLGATASLAIGFERVSQLGAKGIEDVRIGLSPIERSTRYGFFGKKVNGRYSYARPPNIMCSSYAGPYEEAIDNALDLYVELQRPVSARLQDKYPQAGEWKVKQMTFDITRVLLTAACFTNLGIMVNGEAAEHLVYKLKASSLPEHRELGRLIEGEVKKAVPGLMQRAEGKFGESMVDYLGEKDKASFDLAQEYLEGIAPELPPKGVSLVAFDPQGEEKVISQILYPGSNLSLPQILELVKEFSPEEKKRVIDAYVGQRPDRRAKVGRAFEEAGLSFQIVCRYAEWRDLQRNRILTPQWRRLDFSLGYDIGEDLIEFGFESKVREGLNRLAEAYEGVAKDYPEEAQYLMAFGALMPYYITLNFRELVHLVELRSGPGAHPSYAEIARQLGRKAIEAYPLFEPAIQHTNLKD